MVVSYEMSMYKFVGIVPLQQRRSLYENHCTSLLQNLFAEALKNVNLPT